MLRPALAVLAALACAHGKPLSVPGPARPELYTAESGPSQAHGTASSKIIQSETDQHVVQQQHDLGGGSSHGGLSSGVVSSDAQHLQTPSGLSTSFSTDAESLQISNPAFPGGVGSSNIPDVQVLPAGFGSGSASGQSSSDIKQSETFDPRGGKSTITQQQSGTGGQALGGGTNIGSASSDSQSLHTPQGISSTSNTDAKSVQTSSPGQPGFGAGLTFPRLPVVSQGLGQQSFPVFTGFGPGSASGQSGSSIKKAETITPSGGKSTIAEQGSSTGGQAIDGGINVGSASSDTQRLINAQGVAQESSNTDAKSAQGSSPGFTGFGAGLTLPRFTGQGLGQQHFPTLTGFGTATGQSGSNIKTAETFDAFGGRSTVVQQGSSTGGQASGGGINVGSASSDRQRLVNAQGVAQESSNTDAKSMQGSSPGFPSLGGNLGVQPFLGASSFHQGERLQQLGTNFDFSAPGLAFGGGNKGLGHQFIPNLAVPSGSAQGTADSKILTGETVGPQGARSTTTGHQSGAGGQAFGGSFSSGQSSTDTQSLHTPQGSTSSSNTDAKSVQGSNPAFNTFNPAWTGGSAPLISPPSHSLNVFPGQGFGRAEGTSGSNILQSETNLPRGGTQRVVQQGSSTGGQAAGGGINVGSASSDRQRLINAQGVAQESSNTDAKSVQGSSPGFSGFGAGLTLPSFTGQGFGQQSFPTFTGFGPGSATGQSGSNIRTAETFDAFGGKSTVVHQGSSTGGQASGGGINVGSASSDRQRLINAQGVAQESSNTDAKSMQGSVPGAQVLPPAAWPGLRLANSQPFGPFGFGSATGQAGSDLKQVESLGTDGSSSKLTVLGSSAGGSAKDGGTNVSKASGSTSSIDSGAGSQSQSHLDSQSVQTGR